MKTFSTYLTELFEKPWKIINSTEVQSHSGRPIVIYRYADPQNYEKRKEDLEVIFEQTNLNEDSWELLFHRGYKFGMTDQGGASRVFATVLDATKRFIEEYNPQFITFSASKTQGDSREKAYGALIKRFVSKYGYNVDKVLSGGAAALWKLKRKD
jgi:hypothetical protein